MPSNNETKNKLNEGVSNIEFFREEITSLRVSLEKQKVKRKTKRRLKFFIKKLMRRKLKEAFPIVTLDFIYLIYLYENQKYFIFYCLSNCIMRIS